MLLTLTVVSSTPSSASSAEALAPISEQNDVRLRPHVHVSSLSCFWAQLTDFDGALSDHGAVGLVDDAIDLLEVVRVRDDLVVGDNVL